MPNPTKSNMTLAQKRWCREAGARGLEKMMKLTPHLRKLQNRKPKNVSQVVTAQDKKDDGQTPPELLKSK